MKVLNAPPNPDSTRAPDHPATTLIVICPAILPGTPPTLCPELLTEDEAIRYLRLDLIDVEEPSNTLRYYRKQGLLRATQVGKCVRYRRIELDRLLDNLTESNPR